MFLRPLISPLDKRADRGRRGVEDIHFMPIDDVPEAIRFGKVWRAFIHQASRAIQQRSVDDITVAGNPADIGCTPIRIFLLQIEHPLRGAIDSDGIARRGVHNSLRFARRA